MSNKRRIFNIDVKDIADKDIAKDIEYFMENLKKSLKMPPERIFQSPSDVIEFHEQRYIVNLDNENYFSAANHMRKVIKSRIKLIKNKHCTC